MLAIETPSIKVATRHLVSEASDLAILFQEKEEAIVGDSHIWFTLSQKVGDERLRKEIFSSKVQDGCVIKVGMQASSKQVENDVFVSQGHELGNTLHKCSTTKLE